MMKTLIPFKKPLDDSSGLAAGIVIF